MKPNNPMDLMSSPVGPGVAGRAARAGMPSAVLPDIERGLKHDEARRAAQRAQSLPPMGAPGCLCVQRPSAEYPPSGPWEVVPDCPHHGELWRDPKTGDPAPPPRAAAAVRDKVAVNEESATFLDATVAGTAKMLAIELLQIGRQITAYVDRQPPTPDVGRVFDVVAHVIKLAGDADLLGDKALAREPTPPAAPPKCEACAALLRAAARVNEELGGSRPEPAEIARAADGCPSCSLFETGQAGSHTCVACGRLLGALRSPRP